MHDDHGVCVEWRQTTEVRFVAFHREDGHAAYSECGESVNRAGMDVVEPAHERIGGGDAGANDVSRKAKRQHQSDCERG